MRTRSGNRQNRLGWLVVGTGIGLLGAYFLDPIQGRGRRIYVRDQMTGLRNSSIQKTDRQMRNLNNRIQGLFARINGAFRPVSFVSDDTLIQRVRSAMGRKVRHSKSIHVLASKGTITLRGPVLVDEVQDLIRCVARVQGVVNVINELEPHQAAENIPGLQGKGKGKPKRQRKPAQNTQTVQ